MPVVLPGGPAAGPAVTHAAIPPSGGGVVHAPAVAPASSPYLNALQSAGIGTGAGSPGQNSILQDPIYQQAQSQEQAAIDAAAASRDSAINQALIQFGAVPNLGALGASLGLSADQIHQLEQSINPNSASLAQQLTNSGDSTLGQLNTANTDAIAKLRASLAARGMLESGDTGTALGLQNHAYQAGLAKAYSALMSGLLKDQGSYSKAYQSAQNALLTQANAAYTREQNAIGKGDIPGTTTTHTTHQTGSGGGGGADTRLFKPSPTNFFSENGDPALAIPRALPSHPALPHALKVAAGIASANNKQGIFSIR